MIADRIGTDRLLLRPVVPADAPRLVEALADWQVVKWLAVVPWPYTAEDATWFVEANQPGGALAARGERTWAIVAREAPDRLLGVLGLGDELGYWLDRDHWGRGLVPEAARAVLSAHFAEPQADDVRSGWFDGNERSSRVLTRLGFVEEGTRLRGCLARGEDVLSHRMRLTRDAFGAAAAA